MSARHLLVLAIGVVAISWSAPLIRLAEAAPVLVIAALRLTFAAPPMAALAIATRREELGRVRGRDLVLLALAGLALAGHFAFWVASVQRTSVLTSVVLVTMQPLFVGFGAWIALRERPTNEVLLGTAIGIAGALILAGDDLGDRGSLVGDAMAVIGGVCSAIYLVIGRGVRARLSTASYGAIVYSITAFVLLGALVVSGTTMFGHPAEAYVFILLLAVVPQLIGHNAINWTLGVVPAALVAVAILGEPVGAAVIAAVLLDEVPTLLEWLGAAVVLAGVYVALRHGRRWVEEVAETVEL